MDFKFDIRILALSLLVHFGAYGLLSVYMEQSSKKTEAIEVVIRDDSNTRTFLPSKPEDKAVPKEESKNSKFFSERPTSFKKETVAQNLGDFRNSQARRGSQGDQTQKQTQQERSTPSATSDSGILQNLLPKNESQASQESRQSAVNFQVPNLSKGEFTFLNSDFSTYASFYNRITPKIIYNWGNNIEDIAMFPHMREKLRGKLKWVTRVELILDRKGHFVDAMIVNSSGSTELDHAVQDALKNAGPYLNPPTGMIEKDGTVRINGEFTVYTHRPRYANPQ